VQSGSYYNGYGWHRVEPDFVIQGPSHGDNEYVGYSRYFRDELGTGTARPRHRGMSTRGHDTGDANGSSTCATIRVLAETTRCSVKWSRDGRRGRILEGDVIARIEEIR
jgi:cyclophilin family peptidyl-prolyl cis-trans isomerase